MPSIAKLLLYRDLGEDSILLKLGGIFEDFELNRAGKAELTKRIYEQMKALLDLSTKYGFDKNLWHNYLTFILLTNENSFSMTSEKVGANDGTVNHFAKADFGVFKKLFDFDFGPIEEALGIDCFTTVCNYKAIQKKEHMYNRNVSEKVQAVSQQIENAANEEDIFRIITDFYEAYGVGMFGLNRAFRIRHLDNDVEFIPINNTERVMLDDLIGYEIQKKKLVDNTEAFIKGLPANNVLLCGDAGTGKSTSIKALLNEYYDQGLRMIEIYKHQFQDLSNIISQIKNRNYRFIIYMDRPDNVLIYATSNRRHLIKETWNDRDDMETDNGMHRSDTMQEKLSLVARFGVTIYYGKPTPKEFFTIVKELRKRYPEITMSDEELCAEANKWELNHGGVSGRTAQQFINYIAGKSAEEA